MVCRETEVKLRDDLKCYTDIPVALVNTSNDNAIHFMNPITRVLSDTSMIVACVDIKNPYFKIRGNWYKRGPELQIVPQPTKLPQVLRMFQEIDISEIKGLYPHELTDKMENGNNYHRNQHAINNQLYNLLSSNNKGSNELFPYTMFNVFHPVTHITLYSVLLLNLTWTIVLTFILLRLCCKKDKTIVNTNIEVNTPRNVTEDIETEEVNA
jgi:hypothetical protein